jgi:GDP-4-dehydro-6-deoxy-D-mannose reductase
MRVMVTGAGGFAGKHLTHHLRSAGHDVVAAGHATDVSMDFRMAEEVHALVAQVQPQVVYHLAGTSSVAEVARDPAGGNANIVQPAVNVFEAVAQHAPRARVLLVSSCHVVGRPARLPIVEDAPLAPTDVYGAARAAVEYMVRTYLTRGVDIVIARAFHHTGPGQSPRFVLADWAARACRGDREIPVGNLELRRDYSDVRDIVAGYALLAERAERGSVVHLCSGVVRSLADLFAEVAPGCIPVVDASRVRGGEPPVILGSPARAEALGWERRHPWERTVADLRAGAGCLVGAGASAVPPVNSAAAR